MLCRAWLLVLINTVQLVVPFGVRSMPKDSDIETEFQPCVHIEAGGAAQLVSLNFEANVENVLADSPIRSIGLSAGIGLGFVTPSFVPIMFKSLIGAEDCFELGVGTLVQYKEQPKTDDWYVWSDSIFNLGFLLGYRYQPRDSGLLFRACAWGIMDTGTGKLFPSIGGSVGYAF